MKRLYNLRLIDDAYQSDFDEDNFFLFYLHFQRNWKFYILISILWFLFFFEMFFWWAIYSGPQLLQQKN